MKQPSDEASSIALPSILDQGTFEFWTTTEHGIEFKANTPREEWLGAVKQITALFESSGRLHFRTICFLADALNAGEALFGEEYAQAIDDTRKFMQVSAKTIHNAMWILKSVAPSRRRETLTLAHHEVVAPLAPEEQDELLGQAESENMTVAALKKEVKTRHPKTKKGGIRKAIIDLASEEGLHHAIEKVAEWLSEQGKAKGFKLATKWKAPLEVAHKAYRRQWQNGKAQRAK